MTHPGVGPVTALATEVFSVIPTLSRTRPTSLDMSQRSAGVLEKQALTTHISVEHCA